MIDPFKIYPATKVGPRGTVAERPGYFLFCAPEKRKAEAISIDVAPDFELLEEIGATVGNKGELLCRHWLLRRRA